MALLSGERGTWNYFAASPSRPALATISSWEARTPDTPMPPMILPSATMGKPPCSGVTPGTARMRKALPFAAKLSSSALEGRRKLTAVRPAGSNVDAGVLSVEPLQHDQVSAGVDDRDHHLPVVLARLGLGGHHGFLGLVDID